MITPGGNPTCPKCGCWYGPGEEHVCEHNHDQRCCKEHGTHSSPHVGCILR